MSGCIVELERLRYTPAGVPALNFRLEHNSEQWEADQLRRVECELPAVVIGTQAHLLAASRPGERIRVQGFIAARSLKSRQPVLHVTDIEFLIGNTNGIQTEIQERSP